MAAREELRFQDCFPITNLFPERTSKPELRIPGGPGLGLARVTNSWNAEEPPAKDSTGCLWPVVAWRMLALNGNYRMTFHELFQVWHQNATRRRCIGMDDDFMTTVPPNRGGRVGEPIQKPPHMFEVIPAVPGQLHSLVFPNEQLDLEQGLEIADLVTDGGWGDATFIRCADETAVPGNGLKSLKCWDCRQAGGHSSDSVFNRP